MDILTKRYNKCCFKILIIGDNVKGAWEPKGLINFKTMFK